MRATKFKYRRISAHQVIRSNKVYSVDKSGEYIKDESVNFHRVKALKSYLLGSEDLNIDNDE